MTIALFIAVLVGLIVVHEFGHLVAAKLFGIRVDEFGVFFGPTLFRKRVGETDYTVNLWPIGGFVRIFGEDAQDEEVAQSPDRDRAFVHKPRLAQAAVLCAGVFFNALAAWVLLSMALMIGMPAPAGADASRPVTDPRLSVVEVLPGSPAAAAGLRSGDAIVGIEGSTGALEALTPEKATAFIGVNGDEPISLTYRRGDEVREVVLTPALGVLEGRPEQAAIGISMNLVGTLALPPHLALWEGLVLTVSLLGAVAVAITGFLGSALTLSADLSQVAGPVGIVSLVGDAAQLGVVSLITFTALISLNLAVINLLPVPALDGGRLLFVGIEALKGSPIRPAAARALNTLGFVFLILLMLVVTYNDILRITS